MNPKRPLVFAPRRPLRRSDADSPRNCALAGLWTALLFLACCAVFAAVLYGFIDP